MQSRACVVHNQMDAMMRTQCGPHMYYRIKCVLSIENTENVAPYRTIEVV